MKRTFAVLMAVLALAFVATAQRSRGSYLSNAVGVHYLSSSVDQFMGSYLEIRVELDKLPLGQSTEAWLYLRAWEWRAGDIFSPSIEALGKIPLSAITLTKDFLTLNIPDLSQISPSIIHFNDNSGDLYNSGPGGYSDLSINVTFTRTSDWQQKDNGTYTVRAPMADGKILVQTYATRELTSSMSIAGTIIGNNMPLYSPFFPDVLEFYQGNFRSQTH